MLTAVAKEALERLIAHLEFWALVFGALVVIGVAGETFFGVRIWWNNRKLSRIQREENNRLQATISGLNKSAAEALERAGKAEQQLAGANERAATARREAAQASEKAEEFRFDIAKAKERAAEAERKTAEGKLELERIKSPRSLINMADFVNRLTEFKGTEYTFSGVFGDEESINLLKVMDSALVLAGWERIKPAHGFPAINVYGTTQDFPVPQILTSGIRVSVDWTKGPPSELNSLPLDKLPGLVRAAVSLNIAVSSHLSPVEEHPQLVNVEDGQSKTVRISIGKKP